jgi:hypothetical protein
MRGKTVAEILPVSAAPAAPEPESVETPEAVVTPVEEPAES